jgi:hypothetical protein
VAQASRPAEPRFFSAFPALVQRYAAEAVRLTRDIALKNLKDSAGRDLGRNQQMYVIAIMTWDPERGTSGLPAQYQISIDPDQGLATVQFASSGG